MSNYDEVIYRNKSRKHDNDYKEWVVSICPNILWFYVEDVGSYQGQVYGVGQYKGQVAIYEDYYGSCSGCGAWGEGGEPTDEAEILEKCKLFSDHKEAIEYLHTLGKYGDAPSVNECEKAIKEILR